MPHTLVVGLGRAGTGLHGPVLLRLRDRYPELFAAHPIVGFDPRPGLALRDGLVVDSLDRAAAVLPPGDTVVHVCTPPDVRVAVLTRLAALGFRQLVVEKPLASGLTALAEVERLRARYGLDIVVVTQWLVSALTRRLAEVVRAGDLAWITVRQDKPRFTRAGHTDAFDVEIPHALAVAVTLAGAATLIDAGWTDEVAGPLGGAWLSVRHEGGALTTIRSDLTSPVRRREVTLRVANTTVVGHYPVSAEDHHAQLRIGAGHRQVFEDDALSAFLLATYRYFAGADPAPPGEFALHAAVARLLAAARHTASSSTRSPRERCDGAGAAWTDEQRRPLREERAQRSSSAGGKAAS